MTTVLFLLRCGHIESREGDRLILKHLDKIYCITCRCIQEVIDNNE